MKNPDTGEMTCHGARLPTDEINLTVTDAPLEVSNGPEKIAMDAIAAAIEQKLGKGSIARVSKTGTRYVLNIVQPNLRFSEILHTDIANWISEAATRSHTDQSFNLVVPHSVVERSTLGLHERI